jgi:hypothetical protein
MPEERRRRVWDLLAEGFNPMQVARWTGVAKSLIYRMHHSVGGVYRPAAVIYDSRYLSRDERYELARLRELRWPQVRIADALGRSPSTVSRELSRNTDPRTGRYVPERAHTLAWQRQRRPKPAVWQQNPRLHHQVQSWLDQDYSPERGCQMTCVSGSLP